jgi:hypothetical protein
VDERPHAATVADERELALADELELLPARRHGGTRPLERAVWHLRAPTQMTGATGYGSPRGHEAVRLHWCRDDHVRSAQANKRAHRALGGDRRSAAGECDGPRRQLSGAENEV